MALKNQHKMKGRYLSVPPCFVASVQLGSKMVAFRQTQ